ncbi:carbohydrate kinase family protein [Tenggerimyces flavus]|uniref:Carbohydrate kinase n=1 Tax=Tenggerimyces flavus TaxID=1708749 RepID=A0ABV7YJI6_9ACTN|nr:carbohydrate kinase [Tenggerimyces flavus]MBM7787630.1 fructokinase [Tenggerimyces flavus]
MTVLVFGEALVDVVADPDDPQRFTAHPGGSPANLSIALARLGVQVEFAGRISDDRFGGLIRAHLTANDVDLSYSVEAPEQTTLAIVTLDENRAAEYAFYSTGTADWQWTDAELPRELGPEIAAVHGGSMTLAMAPGGEVIERFLASQRAERVVTIDPNVRPDIIGPLDAYRVQLERWLKIADIVKVSSDDLAVVYGDADPLAIARDWRAVEGGPSLVVVTCAGDGSFALLDADDEPVRRAPEPVTVVDTVGAGDSFMAGLLDALARSDRLSRPGLAKLTREDVAAALDWATRVAGVTVSRPGADPPRRAEVP